MNILNYLDKVASSLEARGLFKEAYQIDVIANTIEAMSQFLRPDMMTQYKKPDERERNEEFNFVLMSVKNNPQKAQQELFSYWGPQWGKILFNIARQQVAVGGSKDLFKEWQQATTKAKQDKIQRVQTPLQTEDDPFLSPQDRVNKSGNPDPYFTRT